MLKIYIAKGLSTIQNSNITTKDILIEDVVVTPTGVCTCNFYYESNQYSFRFDVGHEGEGLCIYGFTY